MTPEHKACGRPGSRLLLVVEESSVPLKVLRVAHGTPFSESAGNAVPLAFVFSSNYWPYYTTSSIPRHWKHPAGASGGDIGEDVDVYDIVNRVTQPKRESGQLVSKIHD
jgi:hypothetical protein